MSRSGKEPFAAVPMTASRWPALVRLFGPNGACEGCWCRWWRKPRGEYRAQRGVANRRTFNLPAPARYTGTLGTFARAGFREVARGPTGRPIMRIALVGRRRRSR